MDPKFFIIFFLIIMGLFLALCIASAMRTRQKYKLFEAEPLEEHLDDDLNVKRYRENKRNITVYFYENLMKYANDTMCSRIPKRERYDSKGNLMPQAKSFLEQEQHNLTIIFIGEDGKFNDNYKIFIHDYRDWYTVGDFYKTITEYMTFIMDPSAFRKTVKPEDLNANAPAPAEKEAPASTIKSDYFDSSDDIEDVYDDYTDQSMPFSSNVIVDGTITKPLLDYSEKLAKKRCDAGNVVCFDVSGDKTQQYEAECKKTYNQLSKLFIDGRLLNQNFLQWVLSEHSECGIDQFDKLIAPYIRYIKSK